MSAGAEFVTKIHGGVDIEPPGRQVGTISPAVDHTFFDAFRPPSPSPRFTGRMKELELLEDYFRQDSEGELVLLGDSGSGKTQLALMFAQLMTGHCNSLYLDPVSVTFAFPGLFDESNPTQRGLELDETVETNYLHSDSHVVTPPASLNQKPRISLVIFDGLLLLNAFWDPSRPVKTYMREALGCQNLWIIYIQEGQQPIRPHLLGSLYGMLLRKLHLTRRLDVDAAAILLIKSMDLQPENIPPEDTKTAGQIAEYFGCFPPAIIWAGTAINRSDMTLQAYQLMSSAQHQEWTNTIGTLPSSLWSSYYEALPTCDQSLLKLLVLLSLNTPDPLGEILTRARVNLTTYRPLILTKNEMNQTITKLKGLVNWFTSEISGSIQCNAKFIAASARLERCFMSQSGDGVQGWRPGAYNWAQSFLDDQPFAAAATYLLAASIGLESEPESECRVFRAQLAPLVGNMLLSHPYACAYHQRRFSLVYKAENRWQQVIGLQKGTLAKCMMSLDRHHPKATSISRLLTSTYCNIGRWKDAKQLLSTLLSHQKGILGEQHVETMSTMHDMALTLSRLGRWEDAESLQERVCDGRRQVLSKSHPNTLSAMHSLASIYSEQGRWREAQDLHEHVLQTRRRVLGKQHPDTLTSLHCLASHPQEGGEIAIDTEELNSQVLEAREKVLGPEHPDTLLSQYTLALIYRRQGKWQMAAGLAEKVLRAQREVLGRDHVDTIETMRSLAAWYLHRGLPNTAALGAEIVESRRVVHGDDSPETLASMDDLVSTCWKQGLWAQAENLHLELLRSRRRALGENNPSYLGTSLDLATHYLNQCRWREATLIFREVLKIKRQERDFENEDSRTEDVQQQLDLALLALSLDAFIISPAVPMESVVAHFTGRAGLKDYSTQLQEEPSLPTNPIDGGGCSFIYRIKLQDGSDLAVKCLNNAQGEYKQQTIRELSTWSQLQHKSIASLLGLALFRGQLAMVSPWNERGNVMKYMEQQPDLDRYALCAQVVSAVMYLHKSDVVHGDLKGSNILVSDDGTLQLTDFGLTIMHDTTIRFSKSTNVAGGTLRWMAPELLLGHDSGDDVGQGSQSLCETLTKIKEGEDESEPQLCKETDIYALGMTMLELLTGKQPFSEIKRDAAVIGALCQGKRPNRPKRILNQSLRGPPFWDILEKCWAQTPADRPTASEVEYLMAQLPAC